MVLSCGTAAQAQATAPAADAPPSALVQPALSTVTQSLEAMFVDRWKAPKALKETTTNNLGSIHRDLETTLPALLAAADSAPSSVAGMVPVSQNLGALYDVLLRVTVVAESSAPADQTAALEQALKTLEGVRRTFTDRLQKMAEAKDRQVTELQTALNARPAPAVVAVAPPPCKPTPPAKSRKKVAAKPAGTSGN